MWVFFWSPRYTDIDIPRQMQTKTHRQRQMQTLHTRRYACIQAGMHIGTHARKHQHHYTHRDIKIICTVSPPLEDKCPK